MIYDTLSHASDKSDRALTPFYWGSTGSAKWHLECNRLVYDPVTTSRSSPGRCRIVDKRRDVYPPEYALRFSPCLVTVSKTVQILFLLSVGDKTPVQLGKVRLCWNRLGRQHQQPPRVRKGSVSIFHIFVSLHECFAPWSFERHDSCFTSDPRHDWCDKLIFFLSGHTHRRSRVSMCNPTPSMSVGHSHFCVGGTSVRCAQRGHPFASAHRTNSMYPSFTLQ